MYIYVCMYVYVNVYHIPWTKTLIIRKYQITDYIYLKVRLHEK